MRVHLLIAFTRAAFHVNPIRHSLAIGTDQVALLRVKHSQNIYFRNDIVLSHSQPLTSVIYSHTFKHIVTACEGAVS